MQAPPRVPRMGRAPSLDPRSRDSGNAPYERKWLDRHPGVVTFGNFTDYVIAIVLRQLSGQASAICSSKGGPGLNPHSNLDTGPLRLLS